MALISRDFHNWWDEIERHHRDIEEHFRRLTLYDDNLWRKPRLFGNAFRPWRNVFDDLDCHVGGSATVEHDEDKYRIIVDVQQFAPEEITVRTDDRCITIEGKHHQKKDRHGYVSRQFTRRYLLPRGYNIGYVRPSLSSDGILTITASKLALPAGERILPIRRTYIPAIKAS